LDLTGSNPWSRIPNSEFRTLSGICDWLRINCLPEQNCVHKAMHDQKQLKCQSCNAQVGHLYFYIVDYMNDSIQELDYL
jgi:hypothetical protein